MSFCRRRGSCPIAHCAVPFVPILVRTGTVRFTDKQMGQRHKPKDPHAATQAITVKIPTRIDAS